MTALLKKNWFVFLLLALLIGVVYANSLPNSFVTDDEGIVKEGKNWLTWGRILMDPESGRFSAAPLRTLVYSFTYLLADLQPWAYRLGNLFFHLGTTFLAFLVVKRLVNSKVALLSSVIFAVHPAISEAVAWISGGGYIQYSFFFLLSFYLYLNSKNSKLQYYLSIFFFGTALLTLNRALVLVALFPIYEYCFGDLKKNWKRTLPFLILSSLSLLTFFTAVGVRATKLEAIYYKDGYFYNPLLQWPQAIGSYLSLLFWPQHLTYVHTNTQTPLVYSFRLLILLGYFAALSYTFLKKRKLFFWLALFLIPLLPTLTPLKIAFVVAERYSYLGSLGIIVLFSMGVFSLLKIKELKFLVLALVSLGIVSLGVRTMFRNTDWKDPKTLWERTSEVSQDSSQAHLNNGVRLAKEGNFTEAEKEFIAAIQINPKIGEYYYNLGVLYLKTGHKDQAREYFQKAVELKPNYPDAQKGLDLLNKSP